MERTVFKELAQWKDRASRMPLMVRGARQIGKTYIIEKFAEAYFSNTITINFEHNPAFKQCFTDLDPNKICQQISILTKQKIIPGQSLLFLDEIQECPSAIEAMRYFKEQLPELHVIGAGSLLEFAFLAKDFRMPVGRIEFLFLKPVSFLEFLAATDNHDLIKWMQDIKVDAQVPEAVHCKCIELLNIYMTIGAMPAVVDSYIKEQDMLRVKQLQHNLLNTYRNDFGKYASVANQQHCERIFSKAPALIAKHFRYKDVDPDVQSRSLKIALQLMFKAGILLPIYQSTAKSMPLAAQINEKKFKLLFLDVGLAASQLNMDLLLNNTTNPINKGQLTEQLVGQELLAYQPLYQQPQLYFWMRDKASSSAEIDYLYPYNDHILPVEVKSGATGRLRSLKLFMQHNKPPLGIKTSTDGLSVKDGVLSCPIYLLSQLERFVAELLARGKI
ncbi:MAG: ATP-binding protein [Candidatus Thioglobus sp.]